MHINRERKKEKKRRKKTHMIVRAKQRRKKKKKARKRERERKSAIRSLRFLMLVVYLCIRDRKLTLTGIKRKRRKLKK